MIAHIIPREKFTNDYIRFINNNFSIDEHLFLVLAFSDTDRYYLDAYSNVVYITKNIKSLIKMVNILRKSNKIVFHGIFSLKIIVMIILGGFSNKTICMLWGGDIYCDEDKHCIQYILKKYLFRHCKAITTTLEADYKYTKSKYYTNKPFLRVVGYMSNCLRQIDYEPIKRDNNTKSIIIGNSADETNNHIEVLNMISAYKDSDIRLIIPLSYGNKTYAKEVEAKANEIFPGKVKCLMTFMPLKEYQKILDSIDIAIFDHNRQQGLGNIIQLLGDGKKVYIRGEVTTYKEMGSLGIKVFDTRDVGNTLLEDFTEKDRKNNIYNAFQAFSLERMRQDWSNVFLF